MPKFFFWNVRCGGRTGYSDGADPWLPQALNEVCAVVRGSKADFAGLLDCFCWKRDGVIDRICKQSGFARWYYASLGREGVSEEEEHLGLLVLTNNKDARFTTVNLGTRNCIRVLIESSKVCVYFVYLDDRNENVRKAQMEALLEDVKKIGPGWLVGLMGDLNCLRAGFAGWGLALVGRVLRMRAVRWFARRSGSTALWYVVEALGEVTRCRVIRQRVCGCGGGVVVAADVRCQERSA